MASDLTQKLGEVGAGEAGDSLNSVSHQLCSCLQIVSPNELQDLYRRGLRQAENAAANSFHCRTPNCEGFCFYEDEVNEFNCPICIKQNCLLCKAIHEEQNCQEYQDDLKRLAANDAAAKATQDMLEVS